MHQTCALSRLQSMVVLGPFLALVVLFVGSCGDSAVSPSPVANANLAIILTDAPIDDVDQVNIFFTSVTVKPERSGVQRLALDLAQNPIDLLSLTDRSINFAAGVVEPGRYEFMQINIDEGQSYLVENGVRKPLRVPSQEIKVVGGFVVDNDHKTTVTVDFDAADSLVRQGNGNWLLRPIVVITGHNTSSRSR